MARMKAKVISKEFTSNNKDNLTVAEIKTDGKDTQVRTNKVVVPIAMSRVNADKSG